MTNPADEPKSLLDPLARKLLFSKLHEPHICPLTQFVETIRNETEQYERIPYFDPSDGGIHSKCLFLFETPGPGAVCSGFISRNNPDETAKNFFELNKEARLARKLTISWNIVPWYIGKEKKIIRDDIEKGKECLSRLLLLLPHLRVIVLAGGTARKAESFLKEHYGSLALMKMHHPSPQFINRSRDENRRQILRSLKEVQKAVVA